MELDWCSEEELKNTQLFNDNSVISSKTKKQTDSEKVNTESNIQNELNPNDCFNLKVDCKKPEDLLFIMNYLSCVSNHLRTLIRNKGTKTFSPPENLITEEEFQLIFKFQEWLIETSEKIRHHFGNPQRKDNSFDPSSIKPFKTSSYKFCNFKDTCSIHRNKNRICDKNHFVFEMIINDIKKLSESLKSIGLDNLNYILSNKNLKMIWSNNSYLIERIENQNIHDIQITDPESQFIIDKTLIFKSFDVASYVLNKMYEESLCFLKYNINSLLITI